MGARAKQTSKPIPLEIQIDHPVTKELDPEFRRIECRNDHRKLELKRDVTGLTNNGHRGVKESERDRLRRYLLLLAEDQDSIADVVLSPKPAAVPKTKAAEPTKPEAKEKN